MAAVTPPLPTYQIDLPKGTVTQGKLSDIQLEAVVYAGQAHAKMLPAVEDETAMRRGFFLGDGTGVGKGRVVAAVIFDNWRQGRKKSVWFTKNDTELFTAARRDLDAVGANKIPALLFPNRRTPITGEGVLVSSYAKMSREDRQNQLKAWLGEDFDGVFVFDEAHKMGNAIETRGARGKKKPSKIGLAGIEIQKTFPNARVVYASATGATELQNLAYGERLGLWGRGTAFNDKRDFIEKVSEGGIAALEVVARDLKSFGLYLSRNLSYDGVKHERLVHVLSPSQTALYDDMAEAWQGVLKDVDAALGETEGGGAAKSAAMSAFWGANQRFFNQVLNSLQMPSVLDAMEKDIAAGHSPVLQLVNTNEAAQERALDAMEEGQGLEDLDLTPFEMLVGFVEKSFPVRQWEEYEDEDGNVRNRPVVDSEGKPVLNAEAVKLRDALIAKLRTMKNAVPLGPLDLVVQHFGHEKVAELTGRGRRIVFKGGERSVQKLGKTFRGKELRTFWDDKKQIVIFSDAAGTGIDLHAGKDFKNQRLRRHYLIQAGWRADNAVQGFGRSHRSFQAQPPEFILVSTNVKGQKRFITTIAGRLGRLGAITKGEAKAGSGEMFRPEDNLEGPLARAAFYNLIVDMDAGRVEGWTLDRFEDATGLKLRTEEGAPVGTVPEISRFLNRVLSLTVKDQNRVFEEFETRLAQQSELAKQKGELDVGVEVYRADRIVEEESRVVRTDEETGAETNYVKLREFNKTNPLSWARLQKGFEIEGYARNKKSKRVWAVTKGFEETDADGKRVVWKRLRGVNSSQLVNSSLIRRDTYDRINEEDARKDWDAQVEATPEFRERPLHMITGVLLPVWDRIPTWGLINRLKTEDGAQHLGRVISSKQIRETLRNLGALEKPDLMPQQAVDAILEKGETLELSNNWTLKRSRQGGEQRIEIVGPRYGDTRTLQGEGVLVETVAYRDRFFIPDAKVMATVTEFREIVGILGEEVEEDPDITELQAGINLNLVQKQWGKIADRAIDYIADLSWIQKSFLKGYPLRDPYMAALGQQGTQQYLTIRREAMGRAWRAEQLADHLGAIFENTTDVEARAIFEYLTTAGADPSTIPNRPILLRQRGRMFKKQAFNLRGASVAAKSTIKKLGQNMVRRGVLSQESFDKHADLYLPRTYMKFMLERDAASGGGGGLKIGAQGYLKQRIEDLPAEYRDLYLGEIKDPAFLVRRALAIPAYDLAMDDMLHDIAENSDWVLPESFIEWKPPGLRGTRKVTAFWLKAEAQALRDRSRRVGDEAQAEAMLALAEEMDELGESGLGQFEQGGPYQNIIEDFRQLPDSPRYGDMRGAYVQKDIWADIMGSHQMLVGERTALDKLGEASRTFTAFWKMAKVPLNVPTVARNFGSNMILMHLAGDVRNPPLRMIQALWQIRHNGKYYRAALRQGITASTFKHQELQDATKDVLRIRGETTGGFLGWSYKVGSKVAGRFEKAADFYQFLEVWSKTAVIIDQMRRGATEEQAAAKGHEALFDYSAVPNWLRQLRRHPIGTPFITFFYKAAPAILRGAARHPGRMFMYYAIPYILGEAVVKALQNVDDDDIEALLKALPEWMQDKTMLLWPFQDEKGRWQAIDLSYWLPWGAHEQAARAVAQIATGDLREGGSELLKDFGVFGGPVPQIMVAMKTGKDTFTGYSIFEPTDPPRIKAIKILNYSWRLAMPTWLTDIGFTGHMYRTLTNKPNYRGDPPLTALQASLRLVGVNIYPVNPEDSRDRNLQRFRREINKINFAMKRLGRDKSLSEEERELRREEYREMREFLIDRRDQYERESRVHPRLRIGVQADSP